MNTPGSLQRRAQLAIALTIGFYALAIVLASALLFTAYAGVFLSERIHLRIVLFSLIGGGIILWSIIPRRDKFVEPGPRLDESQQPELFDVLRDVAAKTRQEMPAEVYLIPDVNAYVMYRGRNRRIMGLGLTLMESLSVEQFRAVVAHEFGHYANEDLKYGAWVYRTREAIERTVRTLAEHSGFIDAPFKWYGKFFIRITQEISRAQELAADRLAATVTSAKAAATALIAVRRAAYAYQGYVNSELEPVLARGFRPPVARGFTAFASAVSKSLDEAVEDTIQNEVVEMDDSHPALRERLANLGETFDASVSDEPRATSLLRELPALETSLVTMMWSDPAAAANFASVAWEEAGSRVFVPSWRENATVHADVLTGLTPVTIGDAFPRLHAKAVAADADERRTFATAIAGSALAARLHDLGWLCDAMPGKAVAFTRDGKTIEPFGVADRLQKGELTAAQWEEECRAIGLESF